MGLKKFFRNSIMRADIFSARPTFRWNGQPAYETICGGCLSLILFIFFISVFASNFINILTKVNIQAIVQNQNNPFDDVPLEIIYFAIGINDIDFSQNAKYFSMGMQSIKVQNKTKETEKTIQLQSCQESAWTSINSQFKEVYEFYGMQTMLCPVSGQDFKLSGFQDSDLWERLQFSITECQNDTASNWNCHSQSDIESHFSTLLNNTGYIEARIYLLSTMISAHEAQIINRIIDSDIFFPFTQNSTAIGKIKLGSYKVETDESIWPLVDMTILTGYSLEKSNIVTIQKTSTVYAEARIEKSKNLLHVKRTHGKLDEMLSDVGGLFSLVFVFFFFFMGSFNQYKYELGVGETLFTLEKGKVREENFNFCVFLQYVIYDWFKAFSLKFDWNKMQEIDHVREEATEQMDIRYVIKRIQNLERVNNLLLKEHQIISASLSKPLTVDEAKRLRKITQYYGKVYVDNEQIFENKAESPQIELGESFDQDDQEAENRIAQNLQKLTQENDPVSQRIMSDISPFVREDINTRKGNSSKVNFFETRIMDIT